MIPVAAGAKSGSQPVTPTCAKACGFGIADAGGPRAKSLCRRRLCVPWSFRHANQGALARRGRTIVLRQASGSWPLHLADDGERRGVADRIADGLDGFAADDPLQTDVPHQSRYCATGNIEAFAFELAPDLARTLDGEILIDDATNLDLQSGILPGARRPLGRIAPPSLRPRWARRFGPRSHNEPATFRLPAAVLP
ncbi:hypothetical protein ACVWXN_006740 [Bradyrhizobium sp. i1.4.4]